MKKRVVIGIICSALALAVVFWLGPLLNTVTQETTEVIRLSRNVAQGSQITVNDLEVVDVNPGAIPAGIVNNADEIVGKYAASDLYAGDYLSAAKLAGEGMNADAVLSSLDGKVAISVPINFPGSVSGKLENGDIIRFYIKKNGTDEMAYTPESLMYVRVITTTTSGGVDQDEIIYNDDGSYEMPATVTVLVNDAQARELAHYANGYALYLSLVYRGDAETAQGYIDQQEAYFADEDAEGEENANPALNGEEGETPVDSNATTGEADENSNPVDETAPVDENAEGEETVG